MKPAPYSTKVLENGELSIGGLSVSHLLKQFGSPLYVLDRQTIVTQCKSFTDTLKTVYPNHLVTYAGKAQLHLGLLNLLADQGLGLDVVSGGELYTALQSRMNPDNIYFHGTYKSEKELTLALQNNIRIVVDNPKELADIERLTKTLNRTAKLMLRLKPEIEAHTHDYIKTGHLDSHFGIDRSDVHQIISHILSVPQLRLLGIHSHIGSQILELTPFAELAKQIVGFLIDIKAQHGITLEEINLGCGIGIPYAEEDEVPSIQNYITSTMETLKSALNEANLAHPKVLVEPGRSIIGQAGVTLYTIGAVKPIPDVKTYLIVDGGMADNPRPALYQARHMAVLANKLNQVATHDYDIAGRCCESGDILIRGITLPEAQSGDIIAVFSTGAYNHSMSSNYNRTPRLPIVLVSNGKADLLVKRETYADLIKLDLPGSL